MGKKSCIVFLSIHKHSSKIFTIARYALIVSVEKKSRRQKKKKKERK